MTEFSQSPFLWTPQQPVQQDVLFDILRGKAITRDNEGMNRWFLARCIVDLDQVPSDAEIILSADGRARLHVNNATVGHGPTRSNPLFKRTDRFSIGSFLHSGKNVIGLLINVPGVDLAWYERTRGNWQPVFGDGGFLCELELEGPGKPLNLDWRIIECPAWNRNTPRSGWGQNFIEDFDAEKFVWDWLSADFDDSDWPPAQPMVSIGAGKDIARGWGRVEAFPQRVPSHIPLATREFVPADKVLWVRRAASNPELELDARLYETELDERRDDLEAALSAFLRGETSEALLDCAGEEIAIMLAMPQYHAGYPVIDFEATGGEEIELACGEALPGEYVGHGQTGDGLRKGSHLDCAHLLRITAKPGWQSFEKFDWTAVRAIQIMIRKASGPIRIRKLGVIETHFPAEHEGHFSSSDPFLNHLWDVSRRTALLCMHDSWVDCPGREKRHWVGDAAIDLEIAAHGFGPSSLPLSRQGLMAAGESQRTDGLVQMFAPGDHHHFGLTIPDFTLHWVISAKRYLELSDDMELAEELHPRIETAMAWFKRQAQDLGALCDVPHWHFIEWANIDRSAISGPINAMYCGALSAAALIAERAGNLELAKKHCQRHDHLRDSLNQWHWDHERGVYVDSVEAVSKSRKRRVSQHMNALMIHFGLAPEDRHGSMLKYVTDPERVRRTAAPPIVLSDLPFDDESHVVEAQPYFGHFLFNALGKSGHAGTMLRLIEAFYKPMLDTGTTTLWEAPDPNASLCHVFSATPLFQLHQHILGLGQFDVARRRARISPNLAGLSFAEGQLATIGGQIAVSWKVKGDRIRGKISAPADIEIEICPPPGFAFATEPTRSKCEFIRQSGD